MSNLQIINSLEEYVSFFKTYHINIEYMFINGDGFTVDLRDFEKVPNLLQLVIYKQFVNFELQLHNWEQIILYECTLYDKVGFEATNGEGKLYLTNDSNKQSSVILELDEQLKKEIKHTNSNEMIKKIVSLEWLPNGIKKYCIEENDTIKDKAKEELIEKASATNSPVIVSNAEYEQETQKPINHQIIFNSNENIVSPELKK